MKTVRNRDCKNIALSIERDQVCWSQDLFWVLKETFPIYLPENTSKPRVLQRLCPFALN